MTTVTNAGDLATSRWTLNLVASATTVRFAVAEDTTSPSFALRDLTVGDVVVVDGNARTVTVAGVAAPAKLAPGAGWPALQPGANTCSLTGATGSVTFHPLYL